MAALKRVFKEFKEIKKITDEGSIDENRFIDILLIDEKFDNMNVYFLGPKISYYEEIINTINIKIPNNYPNVPPSLKFINKVYHPNIGQNGEICLDILKDNWKPVYSLRTILLSIISLLSDPNPNSPLNGEAANFYKKTLTSKDEMRKYKNHVLKTDSLSARVPLK